MQVVCVQAFGVHQPGDLVDVPDGAQVSGVYFAAPDDAQAVRAIADAAAAAGAPTEPSPPQAAEEPADAPGTPKAGS